MSPTPLPRQPVPELRPPLSAAELMFLTTALRFMLQRQADEPFLGEANPKVLALAERLERHYGDWVDWYEADARATEAEEMPF